MLCDKCKKREATIQVTQVVNGESQVYNLCAECANDSEFGMLFEPGLLNQILSGVLGLAGVTPETEETSPYAQVVCPTCGMNYSDFVKNSRFGCSDCYNTFGLLMKNSIRELQGSDRHIGKVPKYQKVAKTNLDEETKPRFGLSEEAGQTAGQSLFSGEAGVQEDTDQTVSKPQESEHVMPAEETLSAEEQMRLLKSRLQEALQEEDYEAAAKYRDAIRAMQDIS